MNFWRNIWSVNNGKVSCFSLFLLAFFLLWAIGVIVILDVILWRFPEKIFNHLIFSLIGLLAFFPVYQLKPSRIYLLSPWIFFISFLLLWLVFIPPLGVSIRGKAHWISIGITTIQPIEILKLGWILFLSYELYQLRAGHVSPHKALKKIGIWLILILVNLALQPDIDGFAFFAGFTVFMLFISAQFPVRLLARYLAPAFLLIFFLGVAAMYIKEVNFSSLGEMRWDDLRLVRTSFASNFPFGLGLGRTVLSFAISNPHTDFVIAPLIEETGVLGGLGVLFLFFFLTGVIMWQGSREAEFFWTMLYWGVGLHLTLQFIVNLGVALALLPTAGTPFPLLSWGRTALAVHSAEMAILARRMKETGVGNKGGWG